MAQLHETCDTNTHYKDDVSVHSICLYFHVMYFPLYCTSYHVVTTLGHVLHVCLLDSFVHNSGVFFPEQQRLDRSPLDPLVRLGSQQLRCQPWRRVLFFIGLNLLEDRIVSVDGAIPFRNSEHHDYCTTT